MKYPTDHLLVFAGASTQTIPESGKFVRVIEATDDVYIKLDDTSTELKRGVKSGIANIQGFRKVQVRSLVAQTIRICISDEPQDEGRDDVAVTVSATIAPGDTITTAADVSIAAATADLIVAASATRKSVIIKNPSTNTDSFRIGEAGGVTAGRGFELEPGESIALTVNCAVHGYNTKAGGAQTLSYIEVSDV